MLRFRRFDAFFVNEPQGTQRTQGFKFSVVPRKVIVEDRGHFSRGDQTVFPLRPLRPLRFNASPAAES